MNFSYTTNTDVKENPKEFELHEPDLVGQSKILSPKESNIKEINNDLKTKSKEVKTFSKTNSLLYVKTPNANKKQLHINTELQFQPKNSEFIDKEDDTKIKEIEFIFKEPISLKKPNKVSLYL